jgi:hypothetical protein
MIFGLAFCTVSVSRGSAQTLEPTPQRNGGVIISHSGGRLYELVAFGGTDWLTSIHELRACCAELRSGWLLNRGSRWVAVDTVSVVRNTPDGIRVIDPHQDPVIRADSGSVYRTSDTLYLVSDLAPRVISISGTIGFLSGDTLTVRSLPPHFAPATAATIRKYVRVRP